MECVRQMLGIVMDGIKDTEMFMDYADMAMEKGNEEFAMWFKQHAKSRMSMLEQDWDYVCNAIGMHERIREGDEIAHALKSHIMDQIQELHARYN